MGLDPSPPPLVCGTDAKGKNYNITWQKLMLCIVVFALRVCAFLHDSCCLCYITKEHRSLLQKSPIKHHIRLVLSVLPHLIFALSHIILDSICLFHLTLRGGEDS